MAREKPFPTTFSLHVDADGARIPVTVTRKRVRNLNLRVRGDGSVVMSIPVRTSADTAQEFLDRKAAWIAERVKRRQLAGEDRREARDLQNVPLWQPEAVVVGDMQRRMDLRRFVRRDADFVQQVVALTLLALGAALTASLGHPECAAEHRRRLAQQMEIIRRGAERPETACKGGAV